MSEQKEPLMEGIIGQMSNRNHNKGSYTIKRPFVNDPNMKTYRLDTINYDVPLRSDKLMNANIHAKLLDEKKMRELGFVEMPFHWEYRAKVSFIETMEEYLVVTIGKKKQGINIKVVDEYLKIVYDYQSVLSTNEFDEYANRIHTNVQNELAKLVKAGVLLGYERNDYI